MSIEKLWQDKDFRAVSDGRPFIYEHPQELWEAAVKYFNWANGEDSVIIEHKVFNSRDGISHADLEHKRPFTIREFCLFNGFCRQTFSEYGDREEFKDVVETIRDIIYSQKFAGAATNIYNKDIIARDLGLVDRQDVTSGGKSVAKDFNDFYSPEALAKFEEATGSNPLKDDGEEGED